MCLLLRLAYAAARRVSPGAHAPSGTCGARAMGGLAGGLDLLVDVECVRAKLDLYDRSIVLSRFFWKVVSLFAIPAWALPTAIRRSGQVVSRSLRRWPATYLCSDTDGFGALCAPVAQTPSSADRWSRVARVGPWLRTLGFQLRVGGADAGDEVFAGADAKLVEDVPEVELDGFDADVELGCGLPVGAAGADQPGHRLFGRGEAGQGGRGFRPRRRAGGGELPVADLQVGPGAQGDQALPGGTQPGDGLPAAGRRRAAGGRRRSQAGPMPVAPAGPGRGARRSRTPRRRRPGARPRWPGHRAAGRRPPGPTAARPGTGPPPARPAPFRPRRGGPGR